MKTQKVYFLKGLPASGKSSWAKEKIEEDRMNGVITKRVNKDDLRAMLDNSVYSKEREKFILELRDEIIYSSIIRGYNVIVDDTNFNPIHLEKVSELVRDLCGERKIELVEKFFDTPLQECIERDSKRENPVTEKVIRIMYNQYLKKENENIIKYNPELDDCIVVDIDGTLAIRGSRSPFDYWKAGEDTVNEPIKSLLHHLQDSIGNEKNVITLIVTGRENQCNEDGRTISDLTQGWLNRNDIKYHDIFIRQEGDHRPDYEVKEEIYKNFIEDYYNVLYWIDDRKQVIDKIRGLGITVLDVAGHDF